ncbi:MAG: sugar phosphate isomerase/epimerase [Anaerolineae bacterium]|nr:sugar phosphate isomerase/epimerase [Anaerolineae bacterium]
MSIACSTSVGTRSTLADTLADIARIGIPCVDLLVIDGWVHVHSRDLVADFDATIAPVDALLKQHQLTPIAINSGVSPQLHQRSPDINAQRRDEIQAVIRLMQHLGVSIAAIQPRQPDHERAYEAVFEDCVATLEEQVTLGQEVGVTFALELHVNSPFESLGQARRLLERLPDLPLVYDPTHFVMQGIDLRETVWLMDHARHVHLRDADRDQMQVPFGTGAVDFDWLLNTLKDRGYDGHFSIEYLGSDAFDVLDSAKRLYEVIAQHFPA